MQDVNNAATDNSGATQPAEDADRPPARGDPGSAEDPIPIVAPPQFSLDMTVNKIMSNVSNCKQFTEAVFGIDPDYRGGSGSARMVKLIDSLLWFIGINNFRTTRPSVGSPLVSHRFYVHMEQPATSTALSNSDLTRCGYVNCIKLHEAFYGQEGVRKALRKRVFDMFMAKLKQVSNPNDTMRNVLTQFGFNVLLMKDAEEG